MTFWYNGELKAGTDLTLSIDAPAWKFGATVFTTLRVYEHCLDHPLTGWWWHCDRISHTLQTFKWSGPNWEQVRLGCLTLLSYYPVLRITVFPDGRELITGRSLPAQLAQEQRQGVSVWLATDPDFRRALPTHKTGNYLSNWLALQQAQRQDAREAILINAEGHWLETSTGNLWGWKDGYWWTPPLSAGILPGIARAWIISCLTNQGETVVEQLWTPSLVSQFEALAYTNCVIEYLPIHTVLVGNTTLEYNPEHQGFTILREQFAVPLQNSEMR